MTGSISNEMANIWQLVVKLKILRSKVTKTYETKLLLRLIILSWAKHLALD